MRNFDLTLHNNVNKGICMGMFVYKSAHELAYACICVYNIHHKVQLNWLIICVVNSDDRTILIVAQCFYFIWSVQIWSIDRSIVRSIDRVTDHFPIGIFLRLLCFALRIKTTLCWCSFLHCFYRMIHASLIVWASDQLMKLFADLLILRNYC